MFISLPSKAILLLLEKNVKEKNSNEINELQVLVRVLDILRSDVILSNDLLEVGLKFGAIVAAADKQHADAIPKFGSEERRVDNLEIVVADLQNVAVVHVHLLTL